MRCDKLDHRLRPADRLKPHQLRLELHLDFRILLVGQGVGQPDLARQLDLGDRGTGDVEDQLATSAGRYQRPCCPLRDQIAGIWLLQMANIGRLDRHLPVFNDLQPPRVKRQRTFGHGRRYQPGWRW